MRLWLLVLMAGLATTLVAIVALVVQPGVLPVAPPESVYAWLDGAQQVASPARLQAHVKTLSEDFPGRSFDQPAQLQKAADYIFGQLVALGAAPQRQWFDVHGQRFANIVLRLGPAPGQPGADSPLVVIGAHYDAMQTNGVADGQQPSAISHTPGADANASGVAGLLELARLLIEHPPTQPVELVAYALGEPPHFHTPQMGSYRHASELASRGTLLRLMLSLEMIGYFDDAPDSQQFPVPGMSALYSDSGNFVILVGRMASFGAMRETKAQMLGASALTDGNAAPLPVYSLNATTHIRGIDTSDHQSYWAFGYPALMVTDSGFVRNPHYHRRTDTWDRLDYKRMAQVVNAVLMVALAAPVQQRAGVRPNLQVEHTASTR